MNIQKGFTLVELLIVLALILIISLIVITAINPIEQLNRATDLANESNAANLLAAIERYEASHGGKNPDIKNVADSDVCTDIISAGFVYDLKDLSNELSDWFTGEVTKIGSELYVGFVAGRTKVCYPVKSVRSIKQVPGSGCSVESVFYICLPK